MNIDALQHSNHCWLTVRGVDWAIAMMQDGKILLWRGSVPCDGFEPNIEWLPLRMTDWDHAAYANAMSPMLKDLMRREDAS